MKKLTIILAIMLLLPTLALTQKSDITISNINFPDDAIAGNNNLLFFQIINNANTLNNVQIKVEPNGPYMNDWMFNIPTLNNIMNVDTLINYTQPGNYNIKINVNDYYQNYNVEILPNPNPQPPIIYQIQLIQFNQGSSYEINLNDYVTDVNGDEINWDYISENIEIEINNGNAIFTSTNPGVHQVTLIANDGNFEVEKNIEVVVIELENLIINPQSASIFVNEQIQLNVQNNFIKTNYQWEIISGNEFCSITNEGLVTGLSPGNCIAQATSIETGQTGQAQIEVKEIPTIIINPQDASIFVDEEIQLTASIQNNMFRKIRHIATKSGQFSWSITNGNEFCSITNEGLVTGLNEGTCTVRVDDNNSPAFATTTVTVNAIGEIFITPSNPSIYETENIQLNVNNKISEKSTYTWSITNGNEFCSITNEGLVTGLNEGTCTVRVDDNNSPAFATTTVTVNAIPSIAISPSNPSIFETVNLQLNVEGATSVTWNIENGNEFCSITNEGLVTGLSQGTCTVRVDDNNSPAFATTTVTVNAIPSITISPEDPSIFETENLQLNVEGATSVTWNIENGNEFCSITNEGLVTGLSQGTCTVRVDDNNSPAFATTTVTVNAIPSLTITPSNPSIFETENLQLNVNNKFFKYDLFQISMKKYYTKSMYSWSVTSGQEFCSISTTGLVTGLSQGTCTIRVDDNNSPAFATTTVTVNELPQITINPDYAEIWSDETIQLNAESENPITWSIQQGQCSINQNGLLTPISPGTCIVRIDDNNTPAFANAEIKVLQTNYLSGYLIDIFTEEPLSNALIEIQDGENLRTTTSQTNGFYSMKIENQDHLFTIITKEDYTKRHTWTTIDNTNNEINFTIIPLTYSWLLYGRAFRQNGGLQNIGYPQDKIATTRHWLYPPNIHVINDTTYTSAPNLTIQMNNLIYNIENILPTFNPRDAIPENLVIQQEFENPLNDNEMAVYYDDDILGAGVVSVLYGGPKINKCVVRFRPGIGLDGGPMGGPDNAVFNQEIGTCFGAVVEPSQSDEYVSVFMDPPPVQTYTQDDYDSAKIMLDRARIHYRNQSYDFYDPLGWDWEAHPDLINEWYNYDTKKSDKYFVQTVFGYKGEVIEKKSYKYDEIPSKIMIENPMLFTEEEIMKKQYEEQKSRDSKIIFVDIK